MRLLIAFLFVSILFTSCSSSDNSDEIDNGSIIENPDLKVTVTAFVIDEGNGINGVDDVIEYTISIHNTGDVTLSNISIVNSISDFLDNALTLDDTPNFISASLGSAIGSLQTDETATYNANFTITQSEVDADGLSYSTTVNAVTQQNVSISDMSDDADNTDGNLENDPTEINIEFDPLIIKEYHVTSASGPPSLIYHFNDDGEFYKFSNINQNSSVVFNYDSEGKITTINETDLLDNIIDTHEITYNSNGKVVSIDDHNYIYNVDENFYYDEDSYYESIGQMGDITVTEIYYLKFFYSENPINLITQECSYSYESYYNTVTETMEQEYIECNPEVNNGACFINYDGINVSSHVCGGGSSWSSYDYYTSTTNPLFTDTNNFNILYVFLRRLSIIDLQIEYNLLWSQNNVELDVFSDLPDVYTYEYNYNNLSLPIETLRDYSGEGGTGGNPSLHAKYYYQGDTIPD